MTEEEKKAQELLDKINSAIADANKGKADASALEALKKDIEELKAKKGPLTDDELKALHSEFDILKKEHVEALAKIKAIEEPASQEAMKTFRDALKVAIKENADKIKAFKAEKGAPRTLTFTVKASQVPSDIGQRTDYATFLPGTNFQPVRGTFVLDLFRNTPVGTEYVKYREEDTVTRDAKVVVACATSTHNTKKTWVNRTVQIQKVRDFVDICIDMMDDYDFVESEINQLVEVSVNLKADAEVFMGSGDITSVDGISSEFDPANVLAPYTGVNGFQSPTIAELTAAMKAQIFTFGAEKKWVADTILMNHNDWVRFMHTKNTQGEYLLPNFVLTNGGLLEGMRVITNPLVDTNTLYVLDSTQGQILNRKGTEISMAYENKDNFEHETVTVKALRRLQFLVKQIDQDAFMKCSDIAAALAAITKS